MRLYLSVNSISTSLAASILISVCSLTWSCSATSCEVVLDEFSVFTSCSSSSNEPWAVCNNLTKSEAWIERDVIYLVAIVKQRKYLSSHKVRNPRPSDSALRCSTTELRIILWRARITLGSRMTDALATLDSRSGLRLLEDVLLLYSCRVLMDNAFNHRNYNFLDCD